MIAIALATALAGASPQLDSLEPLADALERSAAYADRLEHTSLAWAEHDRQLLVTALGEAYGAFAEALETPNSFAEDDARELLVTFGEASRALRDWTAARELLDQRTMRAVARELRHAIERAKAIVSATETARG